MTCHRRASPCRRRIQHAFAAVVSASRRPWPPAWHRRRPRRCRSRFAPTCPAWPPAKGRRSSTARSPPGKRAIVPSRSSTPGPVTGARSSTGCCSERESSRSTCGARTSPQQSFLGIAFHVVDWTTYDAVYFRPFNFRAAGQEQRSHAVQYVSHPGTPGRSCARSVPGQFEKALDPAARSQRLVPRPHRPGQLEGRGVRERRRAPSLVGRRPGRGEERRRGAVRRQRLRWRVCRPRHHADGPARAAAREHAERASRRPATGNLARRAGAGGRRRRRLFTRGSPRADPAAPAPPLNGQTRRRRVPAVEGRRRQRRAGTRDAARPGARAGPQSLVAWLQTRGAAFTPAGFTWSRWHPTSGAWRSRGA